VHLFNKKDQLPIEHTQRILEIIMYLTTVLLSAFVVSLTCTSTNSYHQYRRLKPKMRMLYSISVMFDSYGAVLKMEF